MEKIRFGIVGAGNIAHRFARACQHSEKAELCAVASRTMEKANVFGDEFGIPLRFGSYEELAQSPDIDVAYIAVPHALHKPCSLLMMNHKKHVLCEKPITKCGLSFPKWMPFAQNSALCIRRTDSDFKERFL